MVTERESNQVVDSGKVQETSASLTAEEGDKDNSRFLTAKKAASLGGVNLYMIESRNLKVGQKALHIGVSASMLPFVESLMGLKVTLVDIEDFYIDVQRSLYEGSHSLYGVSPNKLEQPTFQCMNAADLDKEHGFMPNTFHHVTITNLFDEFVGFYEDKKRIIHNALDLTQEGGTILVTTESDTGHRAELSMLLEVAKEKDIILKKISNDMKPPPLYGGQLHGGQCAVYKIMKKPENRSAETSGNVTFPLSKDIQTQI